MMERFLYSFIIKKSGKARLYLIGSSGSRHCSFLIRGACGRKGTAVASWLISERNMEVMLEDEPEIEFSSINDKD